MPSHYFNGLTDAIGCNSLLVLVWARVVALSTYVCLPPYRNLSLFVSFVERDEIIN